MLALGVRGIGLCTDLLLCSRCQGTALVLDYPWLGNRRTAVGIVFLALRAYLHFFNSYSKTYGSLGAVIILMLWFYITGLAFLVGGEINSTIEHAAAEHGHPEAKAAGQKAA